MKSLLVLSLLLTPVAMADSIEANTIAQTLRAESPVPFRYGTAQELADTIITAQSEAWYAGPVSLDDSIWSVVRAITLEGTPYVGGPSYDPLVWDQAEIAINPNATVSITPSFINFGEVEVRTPEPSALLLLIGGICLTLILTKPLRSRM